MEYYLSESDRKTLKDLMTYVKSLRPTQNTRTHPHQDDQPSSEIYIAETSAAGITALDELGTGTGTGTGSLSQGDAVPGTGVCNIFQIVDDHVNPPRLKPCLFSVNVYNLTTTEIPGHVLVTVERDKFGSWVVSGASAGSATVTFSMLQEVCVDYSDSPLSPINGGTGSNLGSPAGAPGNSITQNSPGAGFSSSPGGAFNSINNGYNFSL